MDSHPACYHLLVSLLLLSLTSEPFSLDEMSPPVWGISPSENSSPELLQTVSITSEKDGDI